MYLHLWWSGFFSCSQSNLIAPAPSSAAVLGSPGPGLPSFLTTSPIRGHPATGTCWAPRESHCGSSCECSRHCITPHVSTNRVAVSREAIGFAANLRDFSGGDLLPCQMRVCEIHNSSHTAS